MGKVSFKFFKIFDRSETFLVVFFVISLGIASGITTFNALIDPFGIFNSPVIKGVNAVKPRMYNNSRMVKAHQIVRVKPRGLILGTSRSEIGLDPAHPGWSGQARPVYNASLPSGRILEMYHYLLHAHTQNHLKQVVLGLDFFSFDTSHLYEAGFLKERLDSGIPQLINLGCFRDLTASLLSFNAISASIETLGGQGLLKSAYLENGRLDTSFHPKLIKASGGHFGAFEKRLTSTITSPDGIRAMKYRHNSSNRKDSLKWLEKIAEFCASRKIELHMLISPVHAQWQELMFQLDIWNDYEQWKKDVTEVVAASKKRSAVSIELWDFSGFNAVSMEPVPDPGDTFKKMDYYWEASHYKREVGDMMLDRVLLEVSAECLLGFGVKLTAGNLQSHLTQLREAHQNFLRARPLRIRYLKSLIHKALGKQT